MLALRLTLGSHPAVGLRRLLVAAASAGTGFLLLCTLGHALGHPGSPGTSLLRLAWCTAPVAATVYFAIAVARTDPGTRPRPGLSAIGLGPARLMAISATTTALSTLLGSALALLLFLHLRGDLTGMPFDGAAAAYLAAGLPLPLPAALTLLAVVPLTASGSVALVLLPRERRSRKRGAARRSARMATSPVRLAQPAGGPAAEVGPEPPAEGTPPATAGDTHHAAPTPGDADDTDDTAQRSDAHAAAPGTPDTGASYTDAPGGLPWGIAVLAAGLAMEAYASPAATGTNLTLPGGLPSGSVAVLAGWAFTAVGLALAGPGLTHLCGRLLQAVRPGALRLLAGRILMAEAGRIGRPLGVVCAVMSAAYAMASLHGRDDPAIGPLTTLGALLVTGCTVATLFTAAVEARDARTETMAALQRLGAPAAMLRSAAALRVAALLALFGPLTLVVAELAALPLAR